MQASHRKGLTHHPDPESCVGRRKADRRSVDRGTCRPGIELRNQPVQSADDVFRSEGHIRCGVRCVRVSRTGTLRSRETPCMYGYSSRENREAPVVPTRDAPRGPVGEGRGPYGRRVRGWGVRRLRSTDEGSEQRRRGALAEDPEGRRPTKESAAHPPSLRTQRRTGESCGVRGVRGPHRTPPVRPPP